MTDNLEDTGYWHFNADIENQYAGNLIIDASGDFTVTLLGCSEPPKESFLLYGTTANGKKVTLYKCMVSGRRMSFPGIPSVEISAVYCFKGEHLAFNTICFNSALLKFSSLNNWVDIGGFDNFKNDDEVFEINYKNPEPITFYETDTVSFNIVFYRTSPIFLPKHSCEITQNTTIIIKHKSKFELDTFWDYIAAINSFLTLAYFSEPKLQEIRFKQEDNEIECKYAGQRDKNMKEKNHRRNFLFTYKTIKNNFKSIFQQWADLNKQIEPVINVLQECFRNRNIISENKFLNIMQGIETFHRRRRNNEKEPRKQHKKKIEEILSLCPTQHQEWLKGRLHFSNEPTLNDRLQELFTEINESVKEHLFPNYEKIILNAKNTRNYFTHYDSSLKKKALNEKDLFLLTERLKIFLLILLLKETGISDEEVNNIITDGSHFLFNHLINKEK